MIMDKRKAESAQYLTMTRVMSRNEIECGWEVTGIQDLSQNDAIS